MNLLVYASDNTNKNKVHGVSSLGLNGLQIAHDARHLFKEFSATNVSQK